MTTDRPATVDDMVLTELLAKVCDERGWPIEARHLRENSVFNLSVTIGNVREGMRRAYALGYAAAPPASANPTTDDGELLEGLAELKAWLLKEGEDYAAFLTQMQRRRTAEYVARGDLDADYRGITANETKQWQFAKLIVAALAALSSKTRRAEVIEECAKAIDMIEADWRTVGSMRAAEAANYLALYIRALADSHGRGE